MLDRDRTDTGALAQTEPHSAPIFDTGPHPQPLPPLEVKRAVAVIDPDPRAVPPASLSVQSRYRFLKWWKLAAVLVAVWIPAAGVGVAMFSWWFSLADKTPAVLAVLVYVVVCTVCGLILAMAGERPLFSALAIAVLSAVFASAVAAAPLYGHRYCQVKSPCIAGIIPY